MHQYEPTGSSEHGACDGLPAAVDRRIQVVKIIMTSDSFHQFLQAFQITIHQAADHHILPLTLQATFPRNNLGWQFRIASGRPLKSGICCFRLPCSLVQDQFPGFRELLRKACCQYAPLMFNMHRLFPIDIR